MSNSINNNNNNNTNKSESTNSNSRKASTSSLNNNNNSTTNRAKTSSLSIEPKIQSNLNEPKQQQQQQQPSTSLTRNQKRRRPRHKAKNQNQNDNTNTNNNSRKNHLENETRPIQIQAQSNNQLHQQLKSDIPKLMDHIIAKSYTEQSSSSLEKTTTTTTTTSEKYTHTVFGGLSKDQFNKRQNDPLLNSKNNNNNQTIKTTQNTNTKQTNNNNNNNALNRQVTVTASKSVIVSILDTNLNQSNDETLNNLKNFSSSLNDKDLNTIRANNNNINNNSNQIVSTSLTINNNININMNNNNNNNNNNNKNEQFEIELERNYVFRMKKSKNLKYRCNICNYFCDTPEVARKHINGPIHKSNLDTIKIEMKIRDLDMPSNSKLDYLSSFLVDFYNKNVISNEKLKQCYDIYYMIKEKYLEKYPDALVNIYGSVAHGICFNDSSCDISIDFDPNKQPFKSSNQILNDLSDLIKSEFSHVLEPPGQSSSKSTPKKTSTSTSSSSASKTSNLNKLTYKMLNSNLMFNFTTGLYPSAYKTSFLIRSYMELDERAKILAFCFRYIAKLAQIDKVELCTLPPHSYILMVIYFLQKLNPQVVPVLHELIDSKQISKTFNKQNSTSSSNKRTSSVSFNNKEKLDSTNEYMDENSFDEYNNTIDETEYDTDQQQGVAGSRNNGLDKENNENFSIFRKNLHSYVSGKNWKSSNEKCLGELWLKLLTFYSIDFGFKKTFISVRRQTRISKSSVKMYTKKMSIEDPFCLKQSLSRNLMTQTNKYIISVISKACLYFVQNCHTCLKNSIPTTDDKQPFKIVDNLIDETGIMDARKAKKELENDSEMESEGEEHDNDSTSSSSSNSDDDNDDEEDDEADNDLIDELEQFEIGNDSPNKKSNILKKDKKIEKNLSENFDQMLKISSLDHDSNIPSLSSVDTYSSLSTPLDLEKNNTNFNFNTKLNGDDASNEDLETSEREDAKSQEEEIKLNKANFDLSKNNLNLDELNVESIKYEKNLNEKFKTILNESNQLDVVKNCLCELVDKVVEAHEIVYDSMPSVVLNSNFVLYNYETNLNFNFRFTQAALSLQKYPPKICSHCNKEGHLQIECPQDQMPDLENLPDLTNEWKMVLTNVCHCIMEDNRQTKHEEITRNNLLREIRQIIHYKYSNAKLSLFGSSNNGFAMKKSDLDICMTLESDPIGDEINFKRIIRNIGALFRREPDFDQIEERVSAKVPIVKFRHRKTMIEGDISLYNTLALQNTDLLRSYAEIDSRLKVLGHVVKYFAKTCRIGDASCGSLSSYAYIVMMLHYLMNTEPPVLPCLQKLNRDKLPKSESSLFIDGWDCWFNRDIDNLNELWPHYKKNQQTVGELWLGFLRYYTEIFDWDNHVVCIRDTNPLTRKSKNWTKHRLAIEDPFELTHNLAAGVSHKMGLYILKSFAKARSLFGVVVHDFRPIEIRFNIDYFFNPRSLVEGNPPMDRNCFTCSKIGHQTKDCPLANAKRKEKLLIDQEQKHEDLTNMVCYKCRNTGHKAKDCTSDIKRTKTISNGGTITDKCYKCNQTGHYARDCGLTQQTAAFLIPNNNQGKILIQQNIPHVPYQLSAPPPKMISVINPSNTKNINTPLFIKTGDKTQLIVNNNSLASVSGLSSVSSAPILASNGEIFFPNNSTNNTNTNTNNNHKSKQNQNNYNQNLHQQPQHHHHHPHNYQHSHSQNQNAHQQQQQQQTQIILQRQQSYPNQQYQKNNSENVYQLYKINNNANASLSLEPTAINLNNTTTNNNNHHQYVAPPNASQFTYPYPSPINTHPAQTMYTNQYTNQYSPSSIHPQFIIYPTNLSPNSQIQNTNSEFKIFGANLSRYDEHNIDLDVVELINNKTQY